MPILFVNEIAISIPIRLGVWEKPINVIATANSIGVVRFNSAQQNKTLKN